MDKFESRLNWKYLTEGHDNYLENRRVAIELSKEDPLFFINNFVFTYDPRGESEEKRHLPFLLYKYQEEAILSLIDHIENERDQLWEKSRDMGASWCIAVVFYWGWKFKGWDVLLGSRKEDLVDKRGSMSSLMEKIRYMERRIPEWMREDIKENVHDKTLLFRHPVNNNTIEGESNNPYFGTGGRYKAILFDEFSKWEQTDETAWRSAGDATPCRIANSTPSERGKNCQFYRLKEQGIDVITMHWTRHPKKRKGLYYEIDEEKFNLDPHTDLDKIQDLIDSGVRIGSEWYDRECERRSDIEIAQELDIAYDASLAGVIFDKIDLDEQVGDFPYNPSLPLYVGWDFGMDTTSMVFIQSDGIRDYIIDEYENKGEDIYHYIEVLESKPYHAALHFGDPYSGGVKQMQKSDTVQNMLIRNGVRMQLAERVGIRDRINASRIKLKDTYIDRQCVLFQDMVKNWRWKKQLRDNDKPMPEHSIFSHIGEAHGYYAIGRSMKKTNIVKSRFNTD